MVLKGPGARAGGWGETRAPSLILPTLSDRAISLWLVGGLAAFHRASARGCLINSWKAPRLWFGDTRDALIGPLDLVLVAHKTPE